MIKREIEISGKKVPFRSSATIPRLYRAKFKRDIFKDLSKLEKSYKGKTENGEELQIEDLEIFENVAYVMAYHADNSIPAKIEDWLDQFDPITAFRQRLRNGWISLICSPFMRYCHRFWNCGVRIL